MKNEASLAFCYENEMRGMWTRLHAKGLGNYTAKLLAWRTSPNGVFGLKAYFHHFEAALRRFPELARIATSVTICIH
jgi:hypothetical protein